MQGCFDHTHSFFFGAGYSHTKLNFKKCSSLLSAKHAPITAKYLQICNKLWAPTVCIADLYTDPLLAV